MVSAKRLFRVLAVGVLSGTLAQAAAAETLTDTLIQTYQSSPFLKSQRAALRRIDENVAIARSSKRPDVSAAVGASASVFRPEPFQRLQGFDTVTVRPDWQLEEEVTAELRTTLLLYDHGQTEAAVQSTLAQVMANRAVLRDVEQTVLFGAVQSYMDVRRDEISVEVAEANVEVLTEQVRATRDRFELGEVTRTDVSLAEARLAAARAGLASFRGQLQISREAFAAVVGVPPQNLQPPPPLPDLPETLSRAEAIAMGLHPVLVASRNSEEAAVFDLSRARSARGPSVSGSAAIVSNAEGVTERGIGGVQGTLSITGRVPIYQGGRLSAAVRQAEALLAQRKFEVQDTARQIRQNTGAAWANLAVARASITANREQVRAARLAFEGVQEEAMLGARTTLDVLDLEQDLRDAQLQLASSERDEYVAAYQLLSTMGLLTVEHLNLGIPTYNPELYHNEVQNAPYSTVEGNILDKLRDRYSR